MTRAGKCDTCRSRKVKCDEQRPKCGACRKRDRECTYSFGKASAFVVEDPTQLSKHGKPKVAPIVYPLVTSTFSDVSSIAESSAFATPDSNAPSPASLRQIAERDADAGEGVYMTFSYPTNERSRIFKKPTPQQRRRLQLHLERLQAAAASSPLRQFVTSQTSLAARYLNLLGSRPAEEQPFAILGSWVESIPSRIGNSPAVDLAVEYLISSFGVYKDPSFSVKCAALATKAKALRELQLIIGNEKTRKSYDAAIATKIHFMAEVFMGMKNLFHAIHAAGLGDILQYGGVTDVDDEHYWSFLEATYIDDVSEAMIASRTSIYDNEYYFEMTHPRNIPQDAPISFRLSILMMHVFIQMPRLVCLIRHASNYPEDSRTLNSAIKLAVYLWSLVPFDTMQQYIRTSITTIDSPPSPDIADLVSNSYNFDSVQSCMVITRLWRLQVCLTGTIQTLHQNFATSCATSPLPPLPLLEQIDESAALNLARSLRYTFTVCPSPPLIPLRFYTCFQLTLGTWYRQIRRLTSSIRSLPPDADTAATAQLSAQLARAQRMEQFVSNGSNAVHDMWHIQRVNKRFLRAAAIDMAGGPIPDWMPIRVKFESEDGALVMKMEYDVAGPKFKDIMEEHYTGQEWVRKTSTVSPFRPDTTENAPGKGFPNGGNGKLPDYILKMKTVGSASAKYWGYSDVREELYADDMTSRPLRDIPPIGEDEWSESEEDDLIIA